MMNTITYQWSKNKRYNVNPQVVGSTVETITQQEGYCPPQRLVDAAREQGSPIHNLFTWDDGEAADKWRTHQARNVINALVVTVTVEKREVEAPAFVSVGHRLATSSQGEGYRPVEHVLRTPEFASEAISEAKGKLSAIRKRYASLTALAPVWQAIDEAMAAD